FLLLFWVHRRRRKKLETATRRLTKYDLAKTSLQKTAKLLYARLRLINNRISILASASQSKPQDINELVRLLKLGDLNDRKTWVTFVHTILGILCEQFSRDSFGRDLIVTTSVNKNEEWPHGFFKATYYERISKQDSEYLERIAYVYPQGMKPRDESMERKLTPQEAGVAYWVVKEGEMRILEDIRNQKKRRDKGWVDFYDRQHERYRSMMVIPVVQDLGINGQGEFVVGVVTIDTDIPKYFRDTNPFKAFLSDLTACYMALIALFRGEYQSTDAFRRVFEGRNKS
ncbi:unnamed protein product, partial [marine sediment metagenome]